MATRKFEYASLKKLVTVIFSHCGLSLEKSVDVADVILAADRMGIQSHGIQRIKVYTAGIASGRIKPGAELTILRETPLSAMLDANDGMGQPAAITAMNMAIKKAGEHGMGLVTVRNSNHFGVGGYYSMMAAKAGLLGVCFTNSEAMVVPTFGRHPMMGTNPIAVSMPAQPVVFHFDISTSVVPAGKIELYARNRRNLPEGLSVGPDGSVNTDPETFLRIRKEKSDGGLLPLGGFGTEHGGHKGYALSVLVELLTGVFSDGNTSNHVRETPAADKCCHSFLAIDHGMFGEKSRVEKRLSIYLQEIRDSAKAVGYDRIYTHGEAEREAERRIDAEGVPISDDAYSEIAAICDDYGVDHMAIMVEKRGLSPSKSGRLYPVV